MKIALSYFSLALLLLVTPVNSARVVDLENSDSMHLPPVYTKKPNRLQGLRNYRRPVLAYGAHAQHRRYKQYINGIPIWGKQIIVHETGHGQNKRTRYTGQMISLQSGNLSFPSAHPDLSARDALQLAQHKFAQDYPADWHYSGIVNQLVYYLDNDEKAHLAYAVRFLAQASQSATRRPYFLIDAHDRTFLKEFNSLTHVLKGTGPGGNDKPLAEAGLGRYEYGTGGHPFLDVLDRAGGLCSLENKNITTFESLNNYTHKIVTFSCYRHAGDEINGAASPANDAYYFANQVFRMFKDWYHMRPVQGHLEINVHYGDKPEDKGNAAWDSSTGSILIGDGNDWLYPVLSLEILAHEIGHSVTRLHKVPLTFDFETSALDEAFSDMTAKAMTFYQTGKVTNWEIGSEVIKYKGFFRSMQQPSADGLSFNDYSEYQTFMNHPSTVFMQKERLDCHKLAGIFNHAFYILATTPGWNPHKAYDVMLAANLNYWEPITSFLMAAKGVVNSTKELNYPVQDVIAAFAKVGIECTENDCHAAKEGTANI